MKKILIAFMILTNSVICWSQSETNLSKQEVSEILRECDRCTKERLLDIETIKDLKVKVEALGVRLEQSIDAQSVLNEAIRNWEKAYNQLEKNQKKNKFWIWLKGVGAGVILGAAAVAALILTN